MTERSSPPTDKTNTESSPVNNHRKQLEKQATVVPYLEGRLARASGEAMAGVSVDIIHRKTGSRVATAKTATDGTFCVTKRIATSIYEVRSNDPAVPLGFRSDRFHVTAGTPLDIGTVNIPVAGRLTGTVIGPNGGPMASVRVFHSIQFGIFRTPICDRSNPDLDSPTADPSTLTDRAGKFSFDRVLPGKVPDSRRAPRFLRYQKNGVGRR